MVLMLSRILPVALGLCCLAGAAVTAVPDTVVPTKLEDAQPRNVVFILADDHRYDAMSFLNHQFARTPHMDAMARNGVHIKNAFVGTSLCSPSRASILTGLYTFRHRVIDNNRMVPEGTMFFPSTSRRPATARPSSASGTWGRPRTPRGPGSTTG